MIFYMKRYVFEDFLRKMCIRDRFSYTEEVTLSKTAVKEQVICSVDLGINTDAVCSIMRADRCV